MELKLDKFKGGSSVVLAKWLALQAQALVSILKRCFT